MALPMKKAAMKAMKAMKAKVMKAAMKKKAMKKAMKKVMKRKAMKKSNIAKGKLAKSSVFRGTKEKTSGGLTKISLTKNKRGKVVSKKAHSAGQKAYKNISAWTKACQQARKELGVKGFCPVGGKTAQGKALYAKTKSLFKA
jgi:predicted flap endonuclease-1-like 5' DNA nuclease